MAALKGQGVLGTADGIPELSDESGASYVPWGDVRTVSASRPGRCIGMAGPIICLRFVRDITQ